MYGNPVAGLIRPFGSGKALGVFSVTDTFAGHVASGRPPGLDLGNGRCGDPILSLADGKVTLAGFLGDAKVVRILHPNGDESGYAHLNSIGVKFGQTVKRGQQIGLLGTTGATACHLHLGLKRGGKEIDPWPELDQNGGDMTTVTITTYPAPRTCSIAAGTTVDGWNATERVKSQTFATGSSFAADADVNITQQPIKVPSGLFRRAQNGVFAGLYVPSPQVTLGPAPIEPTVPQAKYDADIAALTNRLNTAKKISTASTADIVKV